MRVTSDMMLLEYVQHGDVRFAISLVCSTTLIGMLVSNSDIKLRRISSDFFIL